MGKYHQYVFDTDKRKLVGKFEEMYQQEKIANFDSWHQEDSRQLKLNIVKSVLSEMNYPVIIDIGCGKGSFTHKLKKRNNFVCGVDISTTAVRIAEERFPDIEWLPFDVNDVESTSELFKKIENTHNSIDLIFTSECFSYLEKWKELIVIISKYAKYFMISLYIPENPIGFIKTINELENEISCYFNIIESIHLTKTDSFIIYAENKKINDL